MGAEGAAEILVRKELANAKSPDERDKIIKEFVEDYRRRFANPYYAASKNYVDQIVEPAETRMVLVKALESLLPRRTRMIGDPSKKHGNVPV
jgi:acetyl-CoA carboxylase carboxyltransferase component